MRRIMVLGWLLLLAVLVLPAVASASGVGLRTLEVADPVDGEAMKAAAFYPSPAVVTEPFAMGPYDLDAVRDAPVAEGRFPLVVFSHGNLGGPWGHHDLAAALARAGFIAVTLQHPGDNYEDFSRIDATSTIMGRPLQVSAALSAALADPVLGPHGDKTRVGFIGFSAGGLTGTFLAGARPDFAGLAAYCTTRVRDHGICEDGGRVRNDRPDLAGSVDARFRAFVLMAPMTMSLAPPSLAALRAPALVVIGGRDTVLDPIANGRALAALWPGAVLRDLPEVEHMTFLAPCSARLARSAPDVCRDPAGVDRTAIHRALNAEIVEFFRRTLG